jgi:hypothetical protein
MHKGKSQESGDEDTVWFLPFSSYLSVAYVSRVQTKSSPLRHADAKGERKYSSYSSLTSEVDGGEWSASHTVRAFTPAKGTPVPIVQEAGWASEPV